MNKKTLTASALLVLASAGAVSAQTQDISVIVAPSVGYTSFHKNLSLGESPSAGVRVGFGIGPLLEARGLYERSFDIKQLDNISSTKIERLGGELKLNLWSNTILTPYITAGAGVMNMKYDDNSANTNYSEKQLYTALGAGLKINLAKRVALALEAKDYIFNIDPNNRYLKAGNNADKTLHNFGAQASLDFYLGGSTAGKDAVSRAYRNTFGNGFRGAKFVIEPGIAYIDFNSSSVFKDTYLLGGSAGVDFGQYIGIRGFYYQGTKNPNKLDLDFGKELELYGGNVIARLNVSRGVTPYLTLGAGYLNVKNGYVGSNESETPKSGWFALGGAGLEIPLHRVLSLYGQANVMLNEQDNKSLSTIANPSDVKANWMFQAGLRFNIGQKSRNGVTLYRQYADRLVDSERETNNNKINILRKEQQAKIDSLQQALDDALNAQDYASVKVLADSINQNQRAVTTSNQPDSTTVLSKAQLEELVNQVVAKRQQSGQTQLTDFDRLLLLSLVRGNVAPQPYYVQPQVAVPAAQNVAPAQPQASTLPQTQIVQPTTTSNSDSLQEQLIQRMDAMEKRLNRRIDDQRATVNSSLTTEPIAVRPSRNYSSDAYLKFREINVLAGVGLGSATSLNVGVRPSWQMGYSRFSFAPEAFYIFSKENGYSVSANIFYQFGSLKAAKITPYVGAGLGYSNYADKSHGGVTLSGGAKLNNVLGGNFFVDLSLRPAFSNVFLSAGYSIKL